MTELGALARTLLAMVRNGSGDAGLALHICQAFVDELDVDGAALSVLTGDAAWLTLAATDHAARRLQDQAFALNQGACVEAASSGLPVLVADFSDSTERARWPAFAAAVLEHTDVRAVFALPLQWGASCLGVLELYRVKPGMLSDEQLQEALSAAETASLMMLGLRASSGTEGGWLDPLVAHRAEIHQASGMVSVQLDIDPAEALLRMRARAYALDCSLTDLAHDIVNRREVFTPNMDN